MLLPSALSRVQDASGFLEISLSRGAEGWGRGVVARQPIGGGSPVQTWSRDSAGLLHFAFVSEVQSAFGVLDLVGGTLFN